MIGQFEKKDRVQYFGNYNGQKNDPRLLTREEVLVLDHVWGTFVQTWVSMRSSLENIAELRSATILVTSYDEAVFSELKNYNNDPSKGSKYKAYVTYKLEALNAEDSWFLFEQIMGDDLSDSMAQLGRKMLEKCDGLPLVIKTLGGFLGS